MGRTKRKRSRKKTKNYCACDSSRELILLNSWLSQNGVRRNKNLSLAVFDDTGRGVMTKKKIRPGDELITIPLNLTINVITILLDSSFCSIFLENNKHCLLEYKQTVPFQSLMAFYLSFLKVQTVHTKWHIYLENLPKEYTVPYFLPNTLKCYIHSDIISVIEKQKEIIETSYKTFSEILEHNLCKDSNVQSFKLLFSMPIYEWAYFTVNTRCVFMDLSNLIDLKNIEQSILNIINDNTKISLCPYLDMINHNPNARNETKLLVSRNIENLNVNKLNENLFLDVSFSIYTKNSFESYTQVFICYGDSHNLKLITEYGFFIPDNELDCVTFAFEEIKTFLDLKSKLSQEQLSFISSHGLNKDLYIDLKGLSFNLYGLLMVVKYYYDKSMDVSKLIYSAAICSNDRDLNEIIKPKVKDKLDCIKQSLVNLEKADGCIILNNCISFISQHIRILEKFIKC